MNKSRRRFILGTLAGAAALSVGFVSGEGMTRHFVSPLPPGGPVGDILAPFVPNLPEHVRKRMADEAKARGVRLLPPNRVREWLHRNYETRPNFVPDPPKGPPTVVPPRPAKPDPVRPVTPPGRRMMEQQARAASSANAVYLPHVANQVALITPPDQNETVEIINRAVTWVRNLVRYAPRGDGVLDDNLRAVSMYHAWPITAKVPYGYTIPNAQSQCDYVRHLGSEFTWYLSGPPYVVTYPSIAWTQVTELSPYKFAGWLSIEPWPDGQPPLYFYVERYTSESEADWVTHRVWWYGRLSGDSRSYQVHLYWQNQPILTDIFTQPSWIYHVQSYKGQDALSNKYFYRTEDIPAYKLNTLTSEAPKIRNFISFGGWPDIRYDIHSPLFNWGLDLPDDYMFQPGSPMYYDCTVNNDGCPQDWPHDIYRNHNPGGWGFSHRSKVCVWDTAYTTVLRQDPLGLLAQAIHVLLKYNDPWHQYASPWPSWVPDGPPSTVTPISMVEWVWNRFWRDFVGCTMFQVPVIGSDQRVSSLRTNQMLVACTLLGYRYLVAQKWRDRAEEAASILRRVQVGGYAQPKSGCWTEEGWVVRSDYDGAQIFAWDTVAPMVSRSADQVIGPTYGAVSFSWLRQTINNYFNLPEDDKDWILSTVETTATYAQAFRVYLFHKYGLLYGDPATMPGY